MQSRLDEHEQSTSGINGPDQLPRKLGLLDATLIVIGIVIGSGIFLLPNVIARDLTSATAIISVWVVAGVLSFFGALAYAELGAMMPATGGQYVYLREAYGPLCAFLCGWVFVLAVLPGGIAFLAVGFSIYLGHFVSLTPAMRSVVSLSLVAVLSALSVGTIATVRLELDDWTGHRFTDMFTLLKSNGEWKIISKVFHLHP